MLTDNRCLAAARDSSPIIDIRVIRGTRLADSLTIGIAAACRRYGVSRTDLFELMGRGQVPFVKLGRRILILAPFADAYFAGAVASPRFEDNQLSLAL